MTLDPGLRDLLRTAANALRGISDGRVVAVRSVLDGVADGGDPGREADWLADFLAEHQRAAEVAALPRVRSTASPVRPTTNLPSI
jgi:hypothetical protein